MANPQGKRRKICGCAAEAVGAGKGLRKRASSCAGKYFERRRM